jgi:hypothetical protein
MASGCTFGVQSHTDPDCTSCVAFAPPMLPVSVRPTPRVASLRAPPVVTRQRANQATPRTERATAGRSDCRALLGPLPGPTGTWSTHAGPSLRSGSAYGPGALRARRPCGAAQLTALPIRGGDGRFGRDSRTRISGANRITCGCRATRIPFARSQRTRCVPRSVSDTARSTSAPPADCRHRADGRASR